MQKNGDPPHGRTAIYLVGEFSLKDEGSESGGNSL